MEISMRIIVLLPVLSLILLADAASSVEKKKEMTKVTAKELLDSYNANAEKADSMWQGKTVLLTGTHAGTETQKDRLVFFNKGGQYTIWVFVKTPPEIGKTYTVEGKVTRKAGNYKIVIEDAVVK